MDKLPALILASNSPRRRQLLALGGWDFNVQVADIDESILADESPRAYVERLAREKVDAVRVRAQVGQVILGADTTVVIDGDILGKPANADEARAMLTRLRGRVHQVFTGIAVLRVSDSPWMVVEQRRDSATERDGELLSDVVVTDVPMRAYSADEMERYILSGDPLDKAGAYGIQNPAFQPVTAMSGCYASVMGLPLCSLARLLERLGITPRAELAGNCQVTLAYDCRSPLRLL